MVLISANRIDGSRFYILNDLEIQSIIGDPEDIKRFKVIFDKLNKLQEYSNYARTLHNVLTPGIPHQTAYSSNVIPTVPNLQYCFSGPGVPCPVNQQLINNVAPVPTVGSSKSSSPPAQAPVNVPIPEPIIAISENIKQLKNFHDFYKGNMDHQK